MPFFLFLIQYVFSKSDLVIDFGSYYCKAGNITNDILMILTNILNKRITPSFIAFRNPKNVNFSAKDYLTIEEIIEIEPQIGSKAIEILELHPYSGSGFFPAFNDLKEKHSEALSQELDIVNPIKSLRFGYFNLTAAFLRFYINDISPNFEPDQTITFAIPHSFTIPQMNFIKTACQTAGFPNVRFIQDAYVVSINFLRLKGQSLINKSVLFVDIGATSTKAYLAHYPIQSTMDTADLISYEIDHSLGGAYITHLLVNHIKTLLKFDSYTDAENRQLFGIAEKSKLTLTLLDKDSIHIDNFRGKAYDFLITRAEFEKLIQPQISGIMNVIRRALGAHSLHHIEIVGGSSRIPIIQREICRNFHIEKLGKSLNSDEFLVNAVLSLHNKTGRIRSLLPSVPLIALYNEQKHEICSKTRCSTGWVSLNYPDFFEMRYPEKDINPRLKTHSWTYSWKNKEPHHSNIVFFDENTHDIDKIAELNGTLKMHKHLAISNYVKWDLELPPGMNTDFVNLLVERFMYKQGVSALLNSIETQFFKLSKKGKLRKSVSRVINNYDKEILMKNLTVIEEAMMNGFEGSTEDQIRQFYHVLNFYTFYINKGRRAYKELNFARSYYNKIKVMVHRLDLLDFTYKNISSLIVFSDNLTFYASKFADEAKKPLEEQDFDLQQLREMNRFIKKKYNEIIDYRNKAYEYPSISFNIYIREKIINFVNNHLWYFNLFKYFPYAEKFINSFNKQIEYGLTNQPKLP